MIDSIKQKFSRKRIETEISLPAFCEDCFGGKFWRPHHSNEWRCVDCQPPPNEFVIAEIQPNENASDANERFSETENRDSVRDEMNSSVVTETGFFWWNAMSPVCENCRSQWHSEIWFSDGSVVMKCRTCRQEVDGIPKPWLSKTKRDDLTIE
jgi:hypothetical protein